MKRIWDANTKTWLVPEAEYFALQNRTLTQAQVNEVVGTYQRRIGEITEERDAALKAHDRLAAAVRASFKPYLKLADLLEKP